MICFFFFEWSFFAKLREKIVLQVNFGIESVCVLLQIVIRNRKKLIRHGHKGEKKERTEKNYSHVEEESDLLVLPPFRLGCGRWSCLGLGCRRLLCWLSGGSAPVLVGVSSCSGCRRWTTVASVVGVGHAHGWVV